MFDLEEKKITLIFSILAAVTPPIVALILFVLNEIYKLGYEATDFNVLIILIVLSYLVGVASLYVAYYFKKKEENIVKIYGDSVKFSRKRRNEIQSINKNDFDGDIYITSHCNIFFDVGESPENEEKLITVNRQLFKELAELATYADSTTTIKLIIFYRGEDISETDQEQKLRQEIYERIKIMNEVENRWGDDCLSIKIFKSGKLKDYLVIDNMVFKTIRKTKDSPVGIRYVYIKHNDFAMTYRDWLKNIFENGERHGELINDDFADKTINEARANLEGFKRRYDIV